MNTTELQNALIDLQSRFAFQEDMLQALNQIVAHQSQQIELLQARSRQFQEALLDMQDMAQGGEVSQSPPPHY
jgi:SlyX protein